jgi:hypothetical protein
MGMNSKPDSSGSSPGIHVVSPAEEGVDDRVVKHVLGLAFGLTGGPGHNEKESVRVLTNRSRHPQL